MILLYTLLITIGIILTVMGVETLKQMIKNDNEDLPISWLCILVFLFTFIGILSIIFGITYLVGAQ